MNRKGLYIFFLFVFCSVVQLMGQTTGKSMSYNQLIQIVCNLSDVNNQRTENMTVGDLLSEDVGGFRFHLFWDNETSMLLYRQPNGEMKDFRPVMDEIAEYLERNQERIITLYFRP
jgi:hypothetical protein